MSSIVQVATGVMRLAEMSDASEWKHPAVPEIDKDIARTFAPILATWVLAVHAAVERLHAADEALRANDNGGAFVRLCKEHDEALTALWAAAGVQ